MNRTLVRWMLASILVLPAGTLVPPALGASPINAAPFTMEAYVPAWGNTGDESGTSYFVYDDPGVARSVEGVGSLDWPSGDDAHVGLPRPAH